MDDDAFEAPQNGKPKRHDGKDPWSLVLRAEVLARPELAQATSADVTHAPRIPTPGDAVAVLLCRERNDAQGRYEEVWLDVIAVDGATVSATFDSQPTYVRGVSSGDALTLGLEHVLTVRSRLRSSRRS